MRLISGGSLTIASDRPRLSPVLLILRLRSWWCPWWWLRSDQVPEDPKEEDEEEEEAEPLEALWWCLWTHIPSKPLSSLSIRRRWRSFFPCRLPERRAWCWGWWWSVGRGLGDVGAGVDSEARPESWPSHLGGSRVGREDESGRVTELGRGVTTTIELGRGVGPVVWVRGGGCIPSLAVRSIKAREDTPKVREPTDQQPKAWVRNHRGQQKDTSRRTYPDWLNWHASHGRWSVVREQTWSWGIEPDPCHLSSGSDEVWHGPLALV